jgi:hypothetical protein
MCNMVMLTVKILIFGLLIAGSPHLRAEDAEPEAAVPTNAQRILDRAIAYQGGEKFAKPGAVKNLTVRMACDVFNHNVEPVEKLSVDVSRYLKLEPESFRSEWKTAVDHILRGFDGSTGRYWFKDRTQTRNLIGPRYKEDRDEIREKIDETKYLLRLFFLGNLKGPRVQFKSEPDADVTAFRKTIPCDVVSRNNLDPESTEPRLTLSFSKEHGALIRATAHAGSAGQKSLTFLFRYGSGDDARIAGVLLPIKIEVREQPFGAPKDRISLTATILEEKGIELNTELDPKLFKKPE